MYGVSSGARPADGGAMRLLVVSQYFWPETFRVNDLVAELARRGHAVTVLTGVPNYPEGRVAPDFQRAPARYASYEGADVVRVPMLTRGSGRLRLALNYLSFVLSGSALGIWRLRGRRFDAIFVFQPSPITSCLPALAIGRIKQAPVLLWVLDLWPETLAAVGVVRSPRLLALIGRLVAFIYRRCALVLVQSRAFEPLIEKYAGDGSRVQYFPAWVEPLFRERMDAVEPAPEVREYLGTFNVLFAGNIGEAQDFPAILDAAETLRHRADIRWLVVGDGRAVEWVRSEIRRRSLEESVRLLGRHPLERMPAFFRSAHALLVTLKSDPVFAMTIPGKVQTYLATGLPLIAMLDGEGARVVEESGAGVVCPSGDGSALAEGVVHLAALPPSERAAMGARGRAYSHREFDRDRLLTQLENWMQECASGRGVTRER
jgi:glycosyltransferase involved in cell wall biosynthesis